VPIALPHDYQKTASGSPIRRLRLPGNDPVRQPRAGNSEKVPPADRVNDQPHPTRTPAGGSPRRPFHFRPGKAAEARPRPSSCETISALLNRIVKLIILIIHKFKQLAFMLGRANLRPQYMLSPGPKKRFPSLILTGPGQVFIVNFRQGSRKRPAVRRTRFLPPRFPGRPVRDLLNLIRIIPAEGADFRPGQGLRPAGLPEPT